MTEPAHGTEELIDRVRAGDQAAWDGLVRQYMPLLWHVARSQGLSEEDAKEAVQSTWLQLVRHLDNFRAGAAIAGWLATTVRREALRLANRRSRADIVLMSQAPPPDPEAVTGRQERDDLLRRAMQQLPQRCRTLLLVLAMIDSGDRSYHDIAAALDMPVGSVGPTRARCLKRLRELMATMGLPGDDGLATDDGL